MKYKIETECYKIQNQKFQQQEKGAYTPEGWLELNNFVAEQLKQKVRIQTVQEGIQIQQELTSKLE